MIRWLALASLALGCSATAGPGPTRYAASAQHTSTERRASKSRESAASDLLAAKHQAAIATRLALDAVNEADLTEEEVFYMRVEMSEQARTLRETRANPSRALFPELQTPPGQ